MKDNKISKFFVLKIIAQPFADIANSLGTFALLGIIFSFILLMLSYLSGATFICQTGYGMTEQIECSSISGVYLISFVLKFFIVGIFIQLWYDTIYKGQKIDEKYLIGSWRAYLRNFAVMLAFIFINMIPAVSAMLLINRVPNPLWGVELVYFIVVSIGFFAPFVLMRMYGLVADLIAGNGWKNTKQFWIATQGQGLKLVLATSVIFFVCVFVVIGVINVVKTANLALEIKDFVGELGVNAALLFVVAITVGYFNAIRDNILSTEA